MPQEKSMPVRPKERIIALDFLRGFALLGILLMNIQSFSAWFILEGQHLNN